MSKELEEFLQTKINRTYKSASLETLITLQELLMIKKEFDELNISDTSKEESSMEYYNLYKDTKRQLEELKRDVKRFVPLRHYGVCDDELDEYLKLYKKLSKVGEKT